MRLLRRSGTPQSLPRYPLSASICSIFMFTPPTSQPLDTSSASTTRSERLSTRRGRLPAMDAVSSHDPTVSQRSHDILNSLRCIEEAGQRSEAAIRQQMRQQALQVARLRHLLASAVHQRASSLRAAVISRKPLGVSPLQEVRHAQAVQDLAALWAATVQPWFESAVVKGFYVTTMRRLHDYTARVQKAASRLSGHHRLLYLTTPEAPSPGISSTATAPTRDGLNTVARYTAADVYRGYISLLFPMPAAGDASASSPSTESEQCVGVAKTDTRAVIASRRAAFAACRRPWSHILRCLRIAKDTVLAFPSPHATVIRGLACRCNDRCSLRYEDLLTALVTQQRVIRPATLPTAHHDDTHRSPTPCWRHGVLPQCLEAVREVHACGQRVEGRTAHSLTVPAVVPFPNLDGLWSLRPPAAVSHTAAKWTQRTLRALRCMFAMPPVVLRPPLECSSRDAGWAAWDHMVQQRLFEYCTTQSASRTLAAAQRLASVPTLCIEEFKKLAETEDASAEQQPPAPIPAGDGVSPSAATAAATPTTPRQPESQRDATADDAIRHIVGYFRARGLSSLDEVRLRYFACPLLYCLERNATRVVPQG